jgi:hypothetical protein
VVDGGRQQRERAVQRRRGEWTPQGFTRGDRRRTSTVCHLLDTMVRASEPFSFSKDFEEADLSERSRLHFQEQIQSSGRHNPQDSATASTPVMEDVAMSDAPHVPVYFPVHGPPHAAPTAKLNLVDLHTPFPQPRPTMAPYIRLPNEQLLVPIHSQLPNQILCCLIHTFSLTQPTCLPTRTQGRAETTQHRCSHQPDKSPPGS